MGNGVVVTPDNKSAASQTTYKYATFTTNLTGATGFMMKVTTFGKNILINGAEYEVTYSSIVDARTAVNMTSFFTADNATTIVKDNTLATSVTNDQNGWPAAYTYESSDNNVATVNENGVITAVGKGTAKITAALNIATDDANYKPGTTTSKSIDITVNNPSHTAHFSVNGTIDHANDASVEEGDKITFPANPEVEDVVFKGWATAAIDGTQDDAPSFVNTATETMGTDEVTYYAVFASKSGDPEKEVLSQTLEYDTWTYIGSTTDKDSYRLFHSGSYIESEAFDRSKLSKISIYGGTFGGSSYNKLTIGDGTNTWKSVTVSGTNQTFKQTYDGGIPLNGNGPIRITSNSGSASNTGVRISKVEIYTMQGGYTYTDYCTTVSLDPKPTIVLSATELAEYAGNTNATITASVSEVAYTEDLTVASSAEAVASASISEGTITINALTAGTATITVTAPAVEGFRKNTATIAVTVNEKLAHGLSFSADALNLTVGDTEFKEPNLNNPNSLPVVYSLVYAKSENEGKVATINAETGKITLADPSLSTETQGAVTVKASTIGDNSHAAGEVTYNLVVARKVTATSWSNEGVAVTIDQDEIATLPTASNDGERNLFYESSNTDVASIDGTGAVTFVDYGTTTITVKTTATAEYAATSASYELTFAPRYTVTFNINGEETVLREETTGAGVTAPAVEDINGMVFRGWAEDEIDGTADTAPAFVTATSLNADKTLYAVFANKTAGGDGSVEFDVNSLVGIEVGAKSITQTSNNINFTFSSVQKTSKNGTEVQMAKGSSLTHDIAFPGSIKSIKFEDFNYSSTKDAKMDVEGKKGADGTYATVQSCGSNYTGTKIDFSSNDYDFFKISVGSERTVKFTKMTVNYSGVTYYDFCTTVPTSAEIAISAAKYTTYYNSAVAYEMPEDCKGYVFTAANGLELAYEAKEVVPAGEPLVIYCNTEVTTTKTLNFTTSTENTYKSVEKNDLEGTDVKTSLTPDDNSYFYALTLNKANELNSVGFYWMNSTGAAFTNSAHKAYLKLPKSSNVKGFAFKDLTDAIQKVETEKNNGIIYNVAGQRVGKAQKGLYIKDGRKFIVK